MAYTGASLADGQVATSWGTVYSPSGVKAILKSVKFYNTNAASQTLEVRITRSGSTARRISRVVLAQDESAELIDGDTLILSDGDALEAQTTTTTAVDYTVTGAVE